MNEYEAERQRRIDKNKAQLAALGLVRGNGCPPPLGGGPLAGASPPARPGERAATHVELT